MKSPAADPDRIDELSRTARDAKRLVPAPQTIAPSSCMRSSNPSRCRTL